MPIIRTGRGILYFAHVPKCAGTAIEGMLTKRFGLRAKALLDPKHKDKPAFQRWSRSSPQHIDAETLGRLFPPIFFDAVFTMVRHPAERLKSVYLYQRDVEDEIDPNESFADWIAALPARRAADPFYLDNHARPMGDIVPQGATVFRLEDGTQGVIELIDAFTGNQNGPRTIGHRHSRAERLEAVGKRARSDDAALTPEILSAIHAMDADDYARFGYPVDPADALLPLPQEETQTR